MTIEELLVDYPRLTREDIQACQLFAGKALEDITWVPPAAVFAPEGIGQAS